MPVVHWADQLAADIVDERGKQDAYVFNAGMSVSGPMHIGNLRGELVIPSRVRRIMDADVTFRGVYYTQDRFKGKDEQVAHFENPGEAAKYTGWRLIDVPDPDGCHDNWVEHFNSENQPYLSQFGIGIDPLTTTDFYTWDEAEAIVRLFLQERERVREILNGFRDRKHPDGWIPFSPLCNSCNRIDSAEATSVDLEQGRVSYECSECGDEGWCALEDGKLAWRLEWVALWEVLDVDFEPYGKDHATPGGSRDSATAIAEAFDLNTPVGFAFNWVYLQAEDELQEMTSSGGVGITAAEFLDIAAPEILTYLYLSTRPNTEIAFDPADLPTYYRRFDEAEAVHFGESAADDEKEETNLTRQYELAVNEVPDEKPVRVPFGHAAFVAQTIPKSQWADDGLAALQQTGHVPADISDAQREQVLTRLEHAANWAAEHAPADHVYRFNEQVPDEVVERLSGEQREAMHALHALLDEQVYADKEELEDALFTLAREQETSVGGFFTAAYLCLLSREEGPRLADFILTRGQDEIVSVLGTLEG